LGTTVNIAKMGGVLAQFPTLQQWKQLSCVGAPMGPPFRRNDPALLNIDALVEAYNRVSADKTPGETSGQKVFLLGELFFACLYWANNFMKAPPNTMAAGRKPAIMSLSFTVTKELASVLKCGPGEVPSRLEYMFGRTLTAHGVRMDINHPNYLDAAKREQWRIVFQGGRAYRFPDKSASMSSLELLDTSAYGQAMIFAEKGRLEDLTGDKEEADRHGDCGFALSTSNELYVGPLLGDKHMSEKYRSDLQKRIGETKDLGDAPTYHSSFLAGRPVLCAGIITARDGIVTEISPASGHYQPGNTDLLKVLQLLKTVGMNLRKIELYSFESMELGNAEDFVKANGDWKAIRRSSCQALWNLFTLDYQRKQKMSEETAFRKCVQDRFDALTLTSGRHLDDNARWERAYQYVCWDFALFDPKWEARGRKPPIPRTLHPTKTPMVPQHA
jgi:hypothetical protein